LRLCIFSLVLSLVTSAIILFILAGLVTEPENIFLILSHIQSLHGSLLYRLLTIFLLLLLFVLLGLEQGELFFLNPVSIYFRFLDWSFSLNVVSYIHALAFVVFIKGEFGRRYRLSFSRYFSSFLLFFNFLVFLALLDVLILIDFVLGVADVTVSSSCLPGTIS
jgi:hypothetical protein